MLYKLEVVQVTAEVDCSFPTWHG